MKTRNIAFKFAVLAAVLAAGYAFGFAKGGGSR
ncbi:NGO1622 family putative holin, partial [Neisseria gonorrhoeae]